MSRVSPSSSVSQQVPKPFDISALSTPSFPEISSELLAKLSGVQILEVVRLHYDACVRVAEAVRPVISPCTSCVTSDVSVSGTKSVASSRPNPRARRRARKVASNSELVLRSASPVVGVSSDDPGYCYLGLFPEVAWPDIAAKYGSYPMLVDLIMAPLSEMVSSTRLLSVAASIHDSCVHVGQGPHAFISLCAGAMLQDSIASVPGTLSAFCTWRDAISVPSTVVVGALPVNVLPPLQYLSLFRHDKWISVYDALGSTPTLEKLMSLDIAWYLDHGVSQLLCVDFLPDQTVFTPSGQLSFFEVARAVCPFDAERIWSVKPGLLRLDPILSKMPVSGLSGDSQIKAKVDFSANVQFVSHYLSSPDGYARDCYLKSGHVDNYVVYGKSVFQAAVCSILFQSGIAWVPTRWDRFHFKFSRVFNTTVLGRKLLFNTPLVGTVPSHWLYFSLAVLFDHGSVDVVQACLRMNLQSVVVEVHRLMTDSSSEVSADA